MSIFNIKQEIMNLVARVKSPTPSFFKKLRNIGIALAAAGGAILAAPISLPALVVTIGGYLVTAGAVATAVSQVTTDVDSLKSPMRFPKGVIDESYK
jgi:ABC-type xylose transport system permease subunit